MGYEIHQRDVKFRLRKEKIEDARKALLTLDHHKDFAWVNSTWPTRASLVDMLNDWRWEAVAEEETGDITAMYFSGSKYGDCELMLQKLAPFVESGSYIEMEGERGEIWRWVFFGGKLKEIEAKIEWGCTLCYEPTNPGHVLCWRCEQGGA